MRTITPKLRSGVKSKTSARLARTVTTLPLCLSPVVTARTVFSAGALTKTENACGLVLVVIGRYVPGKKLPPKTKMLRKPKECN